MYSQNMKRTKSGADMLFDKMRHEQQKTDQLAAHHFLEATLEHKISNENLHSELKDGVLLCNLVNKLRPGTIKQVGNKDLPFVKMDNITRFLQGARQLGLNTSQLFETIDLFEAKDMTAVINTILTIEKLHTKRKPSEPIIKFKPSVCQDENEQDDNEEQTKEDVDRSIEGPSTECKETPDKEVENLNIQENNNIEAAVIEESPTSPVQDQELDSSITKSDEDIQKPTEEIKDEEEHDEEEHMDEEHKDEEHKDEEHNGEEEAADHSNDQRDDRLHKAHLAKLKQGDRFAEAQSHYPDVRDIFAYPPSAFTKNKKLEGLDIKVRRRQSLSALDGDVYETGVRPPRSPLRPSYYNSTKKSSASMSACNFENRRRSRSPKNTHKTSMDSGYSTLSRRRPTSPYFSAEEQLAYALMADSRKSLDNLTSMRSTVDLRNSFDEQRLLPSRSTPAISNDSPAFSKERNNRKIEEEKLKLVQSIADEGIKEKLSLRSATNQILAQYQLGNCIGRGQFGSVYRALNLKNGEVVAVKRIKIDDEDILADIMREVELLKAVAHPNVVSYHGFIQKSGYMNIVLEYVENGSLLSTLKAFGAFPEKLVASFCIKILSGLEYLHANQVVHCDLKAANILTTKTGDVKLTDFGVSLNLKIKESDTGRVAGTPNWMAPEVIELRGASVKSDIWSLGCTLIELLTGKPPYAELIAMSALFRIVEDDYPPLPSKISDEMREFLLCCFQKNPDDRPTASELRPHAWLQNNQPYNMIRLHRPPRMHSKSLQLLHNIFNLHENPQSESEPSHSKDKLYNKCTSIPARYKSLDDIPYFKAYGGYAQSVDQADMDDEYISHCFVKTDFSKQMDCKVCGEVMNKNVLFCEVCALLCHQHCRPNALSCPPKINKQQPSYDWALSAKVYNHGASEARRGKHRRMSEPPKAWLKNNTPTGSVRSTDHKSVSVNLRKLSKAFSPTRPSRKSLDVDAEFEEEYENISRNGHRSDDCVLQ